MKFPLAELLHMFMIFKGSSQVLLKKKKKQNPKVS